MARQPKLERIDIPEECRTVKDWFPTRESADAAIPAIRAHVVATGETHTCFCHTHTKPPRDSVPVYIGEFSLPKNVLKAKRFCPCPVCWDEFGKFGRGKIAWFPQERVIRLIGEYCFESLNPEAHAEAQRNFDIEQERRRNTEFLLANLPRLPEVIAVVNRGIIVAKAVEEVHRLLHNRLRMLGLNLWPYVRRGGELRVNVPEKEFRRGSDGEMYEHEIDAERVEGILPGYEMLDPARPNLSGALEGVLARIRPFDLGENRERVLGEMNDEAKRQAADTLSRSVRAAIERIAEIEKLRSFTEPVSINTLRRWGAHVGCPIPYNYSHEGGHISIGRSDYQTVGVPLRQELQTHIGRIDFWTEREPRRQRP